MSTTTATLTRPAALAAGHRALAPSVGRPLAHPALRRERKMAEPEGLAAWREQVAQRPETVVLSAAQLRTLIVQVRDGAALSLAASRMRVPARVLLDAVSALGSRMSQLNKRGARAQKVFSLDAAGKRGLELPPGAHQVGEQLVVILAPGWERTAGHRRDIHRAYAAVVLLDPALDERAIERFLAAAPQPLSVGYAHFAHLRAVAEGRMASLEGISEDLDVKDAYVRAFDELAQLVASAGSAVATLPTPNLTPEQVMGLLRRCFWMLPEARQLGGMAAAAAAGDSLAASRLRVSLAAVGHRLHRAPAQFFPASVDALSLSQFRAVLAAAGYHPTDLVEEGRSNIDTGDLAKAMAAVRAQLVASDPTLAGEYAQLAADFAGSERDAG